METNVSAKTAAGVGILGGLVIAPALIVLILIVLIGCCCLLCLGVVLITTSNVKPNTATIEVISAPVTTTKPESVVKIGEQSQVGDIKWNVIIVRNRGQLLKAADSKYNFIAKDKSTNGKFVQTTIVVENTGKKSKLLRPMVIVDSTGREYTANNELMEWIPQGEDIYTILSLNPGTSFKFAQLFDIPAGATGLKLKITDLSFNGGQEKFVDLGL